MGSCKTGGETNEEGICDVKTGIDLLIHFCHIYLFGEGRRNTCQGMHVEVRGQLSFYDVSPEG